MPALISPVHESKYTLDLRVSINLVWCRRKHQWNLSHDAQRRERVFRPLCQLNAKGNRTTLKHEFTDNEFENIRYTAYVTI